ncbi:hypothetical protein KEM55_004782 [Ascosphaera atra]|nr:hypothetical protein KEM55_004782 [Ascosphaera atra]
MADKMKTEEGDEEGPFLLQKLEAFAEQARGGKVVAGRSTRALDELKSRSLTLPKECSELFAKTEEATKAMAGLARDLGMRIIDILEDPERTEPPTPSMIADYMAEVIAGCFPPPVANEDTVSYIAKRLQTIGGYLEDVSTVASDLSQTVEFERRDPPWVGRAQELKSNKVVPPDADEEIKRLRNAIHEASTALGVKDKSIEEQTIKIELLESRMRDQTKKAETLEKVQAELETAKAERQELVEITEKQSNDLKLLEQEREESKARLEKAKRTSVSTGALSGGAVPVSDVASSELLRENEYLRSEVASLQSAVRYLREENRRANLMDPWAVQRSNHVRSWLNAPLVKTHPKQPQEDGVEPTVTPTEAQDVLAHLLRLTKEASVVDLKKTVPADSSSRLAWRSFKTTPRYHTLKQRDEYEEWCSWKDDVARREREKQRRDALRLKKRAEKKEPPTLFQVYSNAHLSGMPEKEGKENAPTRPESQGKGMVNRAFKILEKIHKHEGDEEANPQGQDQVDVVEA